MIVAMPPVATEIPAAELARALASFFAEHAQAAVLEDGRVIFDMRTARYSIAAEQGRCLLHLWSEERNIVRTICGLQARKDAMRLETRRFGHSRCWSWFPAATGARPRHAKPRAQDISMCWTAPYCVPFRSGRLTASALPPIWNTALGQPMRAVF